MLSNKRFTPDRETHFLLNPFLQIYKKLNIPESTIMPPDEQLLDCLLFQFSYF